VAKAVPLGHVDADLLHQATLGQVFTPSATVERILSLRRKRGRVLDPAAGNGAFCSRIDGCVTVCSTAMHSCSVGSVRRIMNPSAIRKFGGAFPVKGPLMRVPTGAKCVAWFAALMLATIAAPASAQSPCPGIHVKILNIKNSTGTVACALFESPDGFPNDYLRTATNVMVIKIRKDQARCDFEDIPPGTYAMAVIHDENMNGKLDANWLGIPLEGYGFSNDAKAAMGAPSFSAASFQYNGQNLDLTMRLEY